MTGVSSTAMQWDLLIYIPLLILAVIMLLTGVGLFLYAVFGGTVAYGVWIFAAVRGALRALQHRD